MRKTLKIAVIFSRYSESTPSGENIVVPLYIKALERMGHSVYLYEVKTDDFDTSRLDFKFRSAFKIVSGYGDNPTEFLNSIQPDLLVVQNLFPNIATQWMKTRKEPILSFVHNFRFFCASATFFRNNEQCFACIEKSPLMGLLNRCYRNSRLATLPLTLRQIIPNSVRAELIMPQFFIVMNPIASSHLQSAGIPSEKIRVVTNFISGSREIEPILIPNDTWLYVGRLTPEKGILALVKNWPHNHKLHIYGAGTQENEIKKSIELNGNIKYFGKIAHKDLIELLPNYYGAVFPSNWLEGMPLTVLEFLKASLPLIALKGTSVSGFIGDGEAGVLLDSVSEESLNTAITTIKTNYSQYRENAANVFALNFTEEIWMNKMEGIFAELALVKK